MPLPIITTWFATSFRAALFCHFAHSLYSCFHRVKGLLTDSFTGLYHSFPGLIHGSIDFLAFVRVGQGASVKKYTSIIVKLINNKLNLRTCQPVSRFIGKQKPTLLTVLMMTREILFQYGSRETFTLFSVLWFALAITACNFKQMRDQQFFSL